MEAIKIEVAGNIARVIEKPLRITSGTVGLPVEFTFDSQWDGLSKIAVFQAGYVRKDMMVVDDATVVPMEIMVKPNVRLNIGVYGVNEDDSVAIPTIWANAGQIRDGAVPGGSTGSDIGMAKKYYDEAMQAAKDADASAKKAESEAGVAETNADRAEASAKEAAVARSNAQVFANDAGESNRQAKEAAERSEAAADRAESAGGGGSSYAVTYTPQTLTPEQQARARENIGAADVKEVANLKNYVTPQMYGAKGDGVTDDTSAIKEAVENTPIGGCLYFPDGTYYITETIEISKSIDVNMQGVIYVNSEINGIVYGSMDEVFANRNLRFKVNCEYAPKLIGLVGVKIMHLYSSRIFVDEISNFNIGLELYANGRGLVYNTFHFCSMNNNDVQIYLSTENYGWINENNYIGGRFWYYSTYDTSNSVMLKTSEIMVDENGNAHYPNNHTFVGCAFEGRGCKVFDCDLLSSQFIGCRYEVSSKNYGYLRGNDNKVLGGFISNSYTGEMENPYPFFTFSARSVIMLGTLSWFGNPGYSDTESGNVFVASGSGSQYALKITTPGDKTKLIGGIRSDGTLRFPKLNMYNYEISADGNDYIDSEIGFHGDINTGRAYLKRMGKELSEIMTADDVYSKDEVLSLNNTKADEIVCEVTGTSIVLTDSGNHKFKSLRVPSETGELAVTVRGRNVWDEEWEVGNLNWQTGSLVTTPSTIRSKNYIPVQPNTTYYGHTTYAATTSFIKCFYDSEYNFIETPNGVMYTNVFTTPENARYMKFALAPVYGSVYKNNVCINVSDDMNGQYHPYVAPQSVVVSGTDTDAFTDLNSYKQPTIVENNVGAEMKVEYVADLKLYIDKKIAGTG